MIEFTMPSLGSDMDEGTITDWLIKPGDKVTRGQVVAVVDTTKAAVEVECWHDGTVHQILVPEGESVRVGAPLAMLLEPGESAGQAAAADGAPARRRISPAARREAELLGVDLSAVEGSGLDGTISLDDVRRAAPETHAAEAVKPADRLLAMRASIAAAMSRSKREIPHYYLAQDIVLDNAMMWLTEHNATHPVDERLLPAALLLKAVALAARNYPEVNGFWRGDRFESSSAVHVGVAISLRGGGLVAPALHDAADKTTQQLMTELTDLVTRARAGSLRSSEMSDPTITVTNLGDAGVSEVFGVIYPPQVALVGFGKPMPRAAVIDGRVQPVTSVTATLSGDHRASDGHRGALFLAAIADLLQRPEDLS